MLTCCECENYQKVSNMKEYAIRGPLPETSEEWDEFFRQNPPMPVYDCPYADDWCEADDKINTLCDNMFKPKVRI